MPKVRLDIVIRNEDKKESYQTDGILKDNTLSFFDQKQQKHNLELNDQRIDYQRKGDPGFDFIFEPGTHHQGKYYIGSNHMLFDIQTHTLRHDKNKINIVYTLKQEYDIVGHSEILITYDVLKEG